jgi:hypothetical protein
MTSHELRYCRFLSQTIKDLYIERAAMSTVLDGKKTSANAADWRSKTASMLKDNVFRSAVEANFEPFFSKLSRAMSHEQTLAALVETTGPQPATSPEKEVIPD